MSTQSPVQTQPSPVNNIYWIPIGELTAMECSEGRPVIGMRETYTLVEGNSKTDALTLLTTYPGFHLNYHKLTQEQKKRISPFRLRPGKIEMVLFCNYRFKNKHGDYTCGRPLHDLPDELDSDNESVNINGLYGMCVLENYDAPDGLDCPYKHRGIHPEDR